MYGYGNYNQGYGQGYGQGGNTVIIEEFNGPFGVREEIIINNRGNGGYGRGNEMVIVENNGWGGVRE